MTVFFIWQYCFYFRAMVTAIHLLLLLTQICLFSLLFFITVTVWKRSEAFCCSGNTSLPTRAPTLGSTQVCVGVYNASQF